MPVIRYVIMSNKMCIAQKLDVSKKKKGKKKQLQCRGRNDASHRVPRVTSTVFVPELTSRTKSLAAVRLRDLGDTGYYLNVGISNRCAAAQKCAAKFFGCTVQALS